MDFFKNKEGLFFLLSLVLLSFGILILIGAILANNTTAKPALGGTLSEGITKTTKNVHPYLQSSSQPSNALIYSSLVEYSPEGKLEMDLAQDFEVQNEGRTFIFNLKKDIKWHDGSEFTAEDVVYTVDKILNKKTKLPFKINWDGVEVEKVEPHKVKFSLPNPYPSFIINATIPILPAHKSFNFHTQHPIGTGPYKFKKLNLNQRQEVEKLVLVRNEDFYNSKPRLDSFQIKYFPESANLQNKLKKGAIDAFQKSPPPKDVASETVQTKNAVTPNYFAVFFNENKNETLAKDSLREGLRAATDKKEIINDIFSGAATKVSYPVSKTIIEHELPQSKHKPERAEELLSSFEGKKITLNTTQTPFLEKTAQKLKNQWGEFGIEVEINTETAQKLLQEKIKSRNYEALLFGQMLSFEPDPFSFWHSSQTQHPGANLSLYKNNEVDKILEQAREEMDLEKRIDLYREFNQEVKSDYPAIFLYSPHLNYFVRKELQGIKLKKLNHRKDRFNQVEKWHLNKKREWK